MSLSSAPVFKSLTLMTAGSSLPSSLLYKTATLELDPILIIEGELSADQLPVNVI